jgi:hypothetical protein
MGNISDFRNSCQTSQTDIFKDRHMLSSGRSSSKVISTDKMRLDQFRSCLKKAECFYTLSSLIQQYYSLLKKHGKVVVS